MEVECGAAGVGISGAGSKLQGYQGGKTRQGKAKDKEPTRGRDGVKEGMDVRALLVLRCWCRLEMKLGGPDCVCLAVKKRYQSLVASVLDVWRRGDGPCPPAVQAMTGVDNCEPRSPTQCY